ncbi:ScbA/BarX family gamma-butyrolactone biosynthesis protein [Paenarthrobacter sp. AR 02]|uniref:ScbA/BarX family gamma-butyrolactone biosynthesis protein n=1 Tax=Paenarthrobacter sp. AR 02 TaxID=2899821 RepID=UPI0021081E35|nr:ScbA/BarX family gamma-butyrolactone biosynthesis protein [Paenarthrobacter sp. AR 02]
MRLLDDPTLREGNHLKATSARDLSFDHPVPRRLVHRSAMSEVFVTDVHQQEDHLFLVAAQWPRWHVFYGSSSEGYDSALIYETLRQATILVAHTQLGVPLSSRFLLPHMEVAKEEVRGPDGGRPADVTLFVRVSGLKSGSRGATSLQVDAQFLVENTVVATASAGARILNENTYERFRRREVMNPQATALPLPVGISEAVLGCLSSRNVVLGGSSTAGSWVLRVDTSHPIYFDHPIDHVPGALLTEAARQCIRAFVGQADLDVRSYSARFHKLVELTAKTTLSVEHVVQRPDGTTSVGVDFRSAEGELLARVVAIVPRLGDEPVISGVGANYLSK